MEINSTEEQQVEAIKKFFKENGTSIVFGVVFGTAGMFGWRAYNDSVIQAQEASSDGYTQLLAQANNESVDIVAEAQQYIDDNKDSGYSVLAALFAAKQAVEDAKLDEAEKQLTFAATSAQNDSLKAIALIRLSRILIEQNKYDMATTELAKVKPEAFKSRVAELRGDIALKQGDSAKAREQYQLAIDAQEEPVNTNLQQKFDDLAGASA